ncbi:Rpp14/Pop5 family-domain-containing protein [Paecilomyces variotii]|uniref:Ribonuclease P/MRP protein subunit POP5 n=1 Tax=Byssochlamys spectabilis TaxID=264951 RepID=A0A443HJM0_BYSSP|nr:Rpp14/Pop5 family-domain-containing protein [Paecilomyces variotii]RWQ92033.1 Rpp14/Pop5 family-domain-containing protein [Paecilomyces variotii]
MVRIKHRYLLIDILYPTPSSDIPSAANAKASKGGNPDIQAHLRIHAPTPDTLSPGLLAKMVREEVSEMFGDWGVGRLGGAGAGGVSVKYLSPATSTAIIRCPRASFRLVWAALTYLSSIPASNRRSGPGSGARSCVFRVVRVSGTMRKAEEEAIRRARREVVRMRKGEEDSVFDFGRGDVDGGNVVGSEDEEDEEEEEDLGMGMEDESD